MSEGRAAAARARVAPEDPVAPIKARVRSRVTMLVVMLAVGSFSLAQSMVSPILPTVQRALHTNETTVTWVLTSYLLAADGVHPDPRPGGRHDRQGPGASSSILVDLRASATWSSALAPNIEHLIAGRGIQGIGGAVDPAARPSGSCAMRYRPRTCTHAIGMIAVLPEASAADFGTAIAGPIVNILNYHWLFWIPAIALGLATIAAHFVIPPRTACAPKSPDQLAGGRPAGRMAGGDAARLQRGADVGLGLDQGHRAAPRVNRAAAAVGGRRVDGQGPADRHADASHPGDLAGRYRLPALRRRAVRLVRLPAAAPARHRRRPTSGTELTITDPG